jgi:hypothetical protein
MRLSTNGHGIVAAHLRLTKNGHGVVAAPCRAKALSAALRLALTFFVQPRAAGHSS